MASILQFEPADGRRRKRCDEATGTFGEVVIFPGVRIERHDEPAQVPVETPRKQAQKS
ncbi:MAG: hypothetical protein ACPW61_09040 [Methyloligella sp. ZOD6]